MIKNHKNDIGNWNEKRCEIYYDDSIMIYDIFAYKNNSYICIIGRHDFLNHLSESICVFQSKYKSNAIHIEFPPEWERDRWALIILFPIPKVPISQLTVIIGFDNQEKAD